MSEHNQCLSSCSSCNRSSAMNIETSKLSLIHLKSYPLPSSGMIFPRSFYSSHHHGHAHLSNALKNRFNAKSPHHLKFRSMQLSLPPARSALPLQSMWPTLFPSRRRHQRKHYINRSSPLNKHRASRHSVLNGIRSAHEKPVWLDLRKPFPCLHRSLTAHDPSRICPRRELPVIKRRRSPYLTIQSSLWVTHV